MRVKTATRLCLQPVPLLTRVPRSVPSLALDDKAINLLINRDSYNRDGHIKYNQSVKSIGSSQQGASTWLMALFAVAILVTAVVAMLFGNKLGYQRGYHSFKTETERATINNEQAAGELEELRTSHKILTNQVATAKQELDISLANLDELRRNQRALKVESRQVSQLNDLYEKVIVEQGGMPLQVLGAKIEPLPENAFEYGFDVGMLSEEGQAKSLKVTLTLQNKDSFVEVPLDTASYLIEGIVRIRGRFVMPTGFRPLQVKLNLEAGDEQVEQLYDWELGNRVDSMPLSLSDLPEIDQSPITP